MAFLTPDSTRTEYGLVIKTKLIPDGSKLKPNGPLSNDGGPYIYEMKPHTRTRTGDETHDKKLCRRQHMAVSKNKE